MSDIRLFKIGDQSVKELKGQSVAVERSLQSLVERHLQDFLGVRFLASEYRTTGSHGGRIDTLGLDENGAPVIIEYKRAVNENVINQGLFYLDWLLDHKGQFTLEVMQQLGNEAAKDVAWDNARLLCIAGDFTRYDEHAIQQINRNIELIRYRRYAPDLLLPELLNAASAPSATTTESGSYTTVSEHLAKADQSLCDLWERLKAFLLGLGDDVQLKTLKYYFAFKRLRNFACVEVHPQVHKLLVYVKVDPDGIDLKPGFTRDVREIGHYGTGDLEISLRDENDLEQAQPLLIRSYEEN